MTMRIAVLSVATLSVLSIAAAGAVHDVKVTTDTSIDCSSIQTIARDLYRDCKTDEDKAVATWYFVRRVMFHWPHIPTWDTVDLVNSYGIGLCGYQSKAYAEIAQAGGFKARTLHMPGHVLAEVWYDNDWHFFDCQVGWFACEQKDGKRTVASHEDIAANPDIVLKARDEDRASKPFFQCNDNFREGVRYAQNARPQGAPKIPDNRLVINLRRGESITRHWSNEGKSWFDTTKAKPGDNFSFLRHVCTASDVDENDPVNWPYWMPYAVATVKDGQTRYGPKRLFGNGRMVYEPLASKAWRDDMPAGGLVNVADKQPGLYPESPGEPASAVFEVDCPYVAVDAWLDLSGVRKSEQDAVVVYARKADDKPDAWTRVWTAGKAEGAFAAEAVSLKEFAWSAKRYFVKVELRAATDSRAAGLETLRLTTVFINNMYALPYLMPGRNTVRVTAGADLKHHALTLRYAWEEEGKERTFERRIDKLPFEVTITVAGKEIPRMKSVTLAAAP